MQKGIQVGIFKNELFNFPSNHTIFLAIHHPDIWIFTQFIYYLNIVLHVVCFNTCDELFFEIMKRIRSKVESHEISETQVKKWLVAKNSDDYSPFHLAVYKGSMVKSEIQRICYLFKWQKMLLQN